MKPGLGALAKLLQAMWAGFLGFLAVLDSLQQHISSVQNALVSTSTFAKKLSGAPKALWKNTLRPILSSVIGIFMLVGGIVLGAVALVYTFFKGISFPVRRSNATPGLVPKRQ